jgi:hypothetical protein
VLLPHLALLNIGRLDPVGRDDDGPAVQKELQRVLSARQGLTGSAARGGLLSSACCIITEEDVRTVLEVLAYECSWTGVAR